MDFVIMRFADEQRTPRIGGGGSLMLRAVTCDRTIMVKKMLYIFFSCGIDLYYLQLQCGDLMRGRIGGSMAAMILTCNTGLI